MYNPYNSYMLKIPTQRKKNAKKREQCINNFSTRKPNTNTFYKKLVAYKFENKKKL